MSGLGHLGAHLLFLAITIILAVLDVGALIWCWRIW